MQIKRGKFFDPVKPAPEEFSEILSQGYSDSFRIERIVSHGHISPEGFWYDQEECEFVAVLQGNAELEFEDGKTKMYAGDWIVIPAHKKHRVIFTSSKPQCIWLAVFSHEKT